MKTTLLQLEAHDNQISIRDRMSWAKTPRILLIWPRRAREARQLAIGPLDLTLLRRHAAALGAQIALVTRQADIRSAARALAIPCFSNLNEAQRRPWPNPPPAPRPARPKIDLRRLRAALPGELFRLNLPARIGIFAAGVFALLLILFVFLPAAQLRLTTTPRPQQTEINLTADPALGSLTADNRLPARLLTIDLEISASGDDREKLRAALLIQLRQQAPAQFSAALQPGDLLLQDSIQQQEILLEEFSPLTGVPGKSLSLRLRARFRAFFAAAADLAQLAARALDASLPPGFIPRPGSLELTKPSEISVTADGYRWQMRAARAIQPRLDQAQAAWLVRGQTPRRAAQILSETYPLAEAPAITNQPLWWPWLPFLPARITVTTNFP